MSSVREFVDHPQLAARDRWREVGSQAGPTRPSPPVTVAGRQVASMPAAG
jgi:itaconate CoA-transferase